MNRTELIAKTRRAVSESVHRQGYVSAIDVFMALGWLDKAGHQDWRKGRVPCLEKILRGNLSQLTVVVRAMAACSREMGLKASWTDYRKWGKGSKIPLRFSKSGTPAIELAYATHYVSRRLQQKAPPPVRIETDLARLEQLAKSRERAHLQLRIDLKTSRMAEKEIDALFDRFHDEVSKAVDCTQCAGCCAVASPILDDSDVERLARGLGLTPEAVQQEYLRVEDNGDVVFARKPCPLLKDKRCSAYEHRPDDCRAFPHLHHSNMASRLLNVVGNAQVCPIVYEVLERVGKEHRRFQRRA